MPERKLKIGAVVKTRLIPAYALVQVGAQLKSKYPAPPKIGYKSAAGHTEYKDAPDDSPEFQAYREKIAELDAQLEALRLDFANDYSIEAWSWDDGKSWQTEPPDSWQFPETLKRYGFKEGANRRADYIRYELLVVNSDMDTVQRDALGLSAPITNMEVDAALGGFRGSVQGRHSARGRGKSKR